MPDEAAVPRTLRIMLLTSPLSEEDPYEPLPVDPVTCMAAIESARLFPKEQGVEEVGVGAHRLSAKRPGRFLSLPDLLDQFFPSIQIPLCLVPEASHPALEHPREARVGIPRYEKGPGQRSEKPRPTKRGSKRAA